jgi:hypothetical protein
MYLALLRAHQTPEKAQQKRELQSRNMAVLRENQTPEESQQKNNQRTWHI